MTEQEILSDGRLRHIVAKSLAIGLAVMIDASDFKHRDRGQGGRVDELLPALRQLAVLRHPLEKLLEADLG